MFHFTNVYFHLKSMFPNCYKIIQKTVTIREHFRLLLPYCFFENLKKVAIFLILWFYTFELFLLYSKKFANIFCYILIIYLSAIAEKVAKILRFYFELFRRFLNFLNFSRNLPNFPLLSDNIFVRYLGERGQKT